MSSKKVKSYVDDNYWRTSIEEAKLNDETWEVKVILIEPAGNDLDRIYLNKFETAEARRFVIKNICKTETVLMINQLSGEKKTKEDNIRIFEECQAFLKENKDIPPDILALLIKHLILKMKSEYLSIEQQKLAVEKGLRNESATMINKAEIRGTATARQADPNTIKIKNRSSDREKEDYGKPNIENKYHTTLRLRGEEWRDKSYIEDYPIDGPNLYVAITGFIEPYLAGCLVKIGIPLIAVVQLRIEPTTVKISSSLFRTMKKGQSKTELLSKKCFKFWEDIQLLRSKSDNDSLKNTAFVVFSPPFCKEEGLSGDQEKIYDELSYLLYDLHDLTRQHAHYLNNLHVISIPDETTNEILHKKYSMEKKLSLESTTLYTILDSILQTVSKNIVVEDVNIQPSETDSSTSENILQTIESSKIETFVKEVFNNLCATNMHKKEYRLTLSNEYEHNKDPLVINFGDLSEYNTFHIEDFNLHNIIRSTLLGMPINKLWQYFDRLSEESEAKINFHVNVLLSCFNRKNVETTELNRLINILCCRKLYNIRNSLKNHLPDSTMVHLKKKLLKRSHLVEPLKSIISWSKTVNSSISSVHQSPSNKSKENLSNEETEPASSVKLLFLCSDLSELVSDVEIEGKYPSNHMIEDFEYFEEFKDVAALQVLHDAYNRFNRVHYKYCEVTDNLILMFFNNCDNDGISREEWRGHIATPVCLQDFFDFVLDEHYEWIQNEEEAYYQNITPTSQFVSKDVKNSLATAGCIDSIKVESELLMEGSLKHRNLVKRKDVPIDELLESNIFNNKTSSVFTLNNYLKNSKRTISSKPSTPKSLHETHSVKSFDQKDKEASSKKIFNGYNLCDRRVEAFGRESAYFSKDGTKVFSKFTSFTHTNVDYLSLNVVSSNGFNEFWMQRALDGNIEPKVLNISESFRICTKNNISIYIKKLIFTIPDTLKYSNSKETILKSFSSSKTIQQNISEISSHSLSLTWPNALITETVYDNNSTVISYVKQFYTSSFILDTENKRCISMNGEVIIFKNDGNIEILQPAGSYIKITKCEKLKKDELIQEDIHSEISSAKNKKIKGKDTNKESSRTKLPNNEWYGVGKRPEIININYDLVVDEYEITHTNGLRQKWMNDTCSDIEQLLMRTATDYCLGEIFTKRTDGTNILLNKDGELVVTYPNNTRIITSFITESDEIYPEWTEKDIEYFCLNDVVEFENGSDENIEPLNEMTYKKRDDGFISVYIVYTIEHPNYTTVTINKANDEVSLKSPDNICVTIDKENKYEFQLDDVTSANFNGESLTINSKTCSKCMHNNICTVNIKRNGKNYGNISNVWLHMKDSFGKNVIVDEEGEIHVTEHDESGHTLRVNELYEENNKRENLRIRSKSSNASHKECTTLNEAKSMKFFVLNRDLTCAELVHRALVDEYKQTYRGLPWCSINEYKTFTGYRSLLSILTPILRTESEKWIMDSKFSNKPKQLVYKDLKDDNGKGFYAWMRPYKIFERKPVTSENSAPNQLPRAYILRTLERQWDDDKRDNLKGAKELVHAILKYRHVMESNSKNILDVPIRDFRSEDKQKSDDIIQSIAHRVYEDLKKRLDAYLQSTAQRTITTQPLSKGGKTEVNKTTSPNYREKRTNQEINADFIKEVENAAEISQNLKRYWRRRNEEYNKEQFYKYLLREGKVPPYFHNALGGAIWWDISTTVDEAMSKVDQSMMTCVCAEESASDVHQ